MRRVAPLAERPLTPALSSEYGGEGARHRDTEALHPVRAGKSHRYV